MCDLHVETWRQLVPPLSKLYLSLLCDRHCAGSGAQERSLLGKITLKISRKKEKEGNLIIPKTGQIFHPYLYKISFIIYYKRHNFTL